MLNKTDLRIKAKLIRKELDIKNISHNLCEKIKQSDIFKNAKNVMIFYPLNNEINLLELLSEDKNFYLPKIKGLSLEACPYKNGDKLETIQFNIKEPTSLPISPQILDLIIVPALMVDKNNYRLGYGKGYYDRFLNQTNAKTLVCIEKELIIKKLPIEAHDKKIDIIIHD